VWKSEICGVDVLTAQTSEDRQSRKLLALTDNDLFEVERLKGLLRILQCQLGVNKICFCVVQVNREVFRTSGHLGGCCWWRRGGGGGGATYTNIINFAHGLIT
jgi:hypothetical protein